MAVCASPPPQHRVTVKHEAPDVLVARMLGALRMVKFKPTQDKDTFRNGLISGDKAILYPILVRCQSAAAQTPAVPPCAAAADTAALTLLFPPRSSCGHPRPTSCPTSRR